MPSLSLSSRFGFSIFHRILATLVLVSLIPLGAIWYMGHRTNLELTSSKIEQQLSASNRNLTSQVDDWVEMNQRMLLQNASLPDMSSMSAPRQNPLLASIPDQYDWAYLAFTIGLDGNNVGRSDGKKTKYYGDRSYFQSVRDGEPFGQQILIGKTSGKPALILSAPVYDEMSRLNGVIAIAMTLSEMSNRITNTKIGRTGFSFLLDENGEVIAHPNEEFTRSRVDMSGHPALAALAKGETTSVFTDPDGNRVLAIAEKSKQGWVMITQQDHDEAFQLIKEENLKAIILLVVTLLLVLIVALFVSQRISAPIRDLTSIADQFSQGKLDLKIGQLERKDEIGHLAQAIDRLGTSIRLAMQRLQNS